jgi:hypothetical protein
MCSSALIVRRSNIKSKEEVELRRFKEINSGKTSPKADFSMPCF